MAESRRIMQRERYQCGPRHQRRTTAPARPDLPAARRPRRVPPPFRGRLSRDGSGLLAPARRGRHAHGSERGALDQLLGAVSVRGEDRGGKDQRRLRGSVDRGAAQRAAGLRRRPRPAVARWILRRRRAHPAIRRQAVFPVRKRRSQVLNLATRVN